MIRNIFFGVVVLAAVLVVGFFGNYVWKQWRGGRGIVEYPVKGEINVVKDVNQTSLPLPTTEASVPVSMPPTATITSQSNVAPVEPQVTPSQSIAVPAGATVNVVVNCCPPEKESAPKAVIKKPKAKKTTIAKKKPAPAVVSPAPVAEVSPSPARFEKQPVGPCGSVDCPPTAQVLVGSARFQPAGCAGCP